MAGAGSLPPVERGDVTACFSPEEGADDQVASPSCPTLRNRLSDTAGLSLLCYLGVQAPWWPNGSGAGLQKHCPNCQGRMWPTFLGLFANVAQRIGVKAAMLAERAHIRSPVLPSCHRDFWCILPTQMDVHFTLQGERGPYIPNSTRVGSLIEYCLLQQNSAVPELRKPSMDKFPRQVFFRF